MFKEFKLHFLEIKKTEKISSNKKIRAQIAQTQRPPLWRKAIKRQNWIDSKFHAENLSSQPARLTTTWGLTARGTL